jgi:hypothetical protein
VPALNLLKNCALLFCLFAPSAWMIATIPPLWRDSDAYLQLTVHPLITTFWGHGPAYCYLAKIPLFLGEHLERWQGITAVAAESGSSPLTDTGVWLLISAQHLALGGAAFYFIRSVSSAFWIRLGLALIWASNALVYTFAHCTGSETLSLILIVLLTAKGLRLIRTRRQPRWIDWYLFAITFCLCLLTRYVNVLLLLLLPVTFVLSWAQNRVTSLFTANEQQWVWRRALGSRQLRQAVVALAIGVASLAVANALPHYLARKTKLHPHSRIGHTLMWRLQFMKMLPPTERAALLQKVTARTGSTETRMLLTLLGQMHEEGADVVGRSFMQRAAALLFPGETPIPWEKLDVAVNQMAYAFLLPPTPEHWHIVRTDLAAALQMSVTEIVDQLFDTTGYFFDHKDEMPACANLVTFRDTSAAAINRIPFERAYFHLWQGWNYKKTIMIWFGAFLVYLLIARWKKVNAGPIAAFGISLVAIGLVTIVSACLLTEFLPRYALPMWLLLLLSLYILCGSAANLIVLPRSRRPARHGEALRRPVGGAAVQ